MQTAVEGAAQPPTREALSRPADEKAGQPILEIENLSVQFRSSHGLQRCGVITDPKVIVSNLMGRPFGDFTEAMI